MGDFMQNLDFIKSREAIKYWLLGKAEENPNYYDVLRAMQVAEKAHVGFRKDGITPIMLHQISIALYLKTIHKNFINPVEVLCLAFLHDVYEDNPIVFFEDVENCSVLSKYVEKTKILSKKEWLKEYADDGSIIITGSVKKDLDLYFKQISQCPSCSLVKGVDRLHNLATMIGVFNKEKQFQYVEEVKQYFLPMLKTARKAFPKQENAFENLKSVLTIQYEAIKQLLN